MAFGSDDEDGETRGENIKRNLEVHFTEAAADDLRGRRTRRRLQELATNLIDNRLEELVELIASDPALLMPVTDNRHQCRGCKELITEAVTCRKCQGIFCYTTRSTDLCHDVFPDRRYDSGMYFVSLNCGEEEDPSVDDDGTDDREEHTHVVGVPRQACSECRAKSKEVKKTAKSKNRNAD